ncbi:hypothetical protein NJI34_43705 [Pseudomonas sp. S 311-6]|nr:hypothetical protein [Pseudomonas sp. S 311-6]
MPRRKSPPRPLARCEICGAEIPHKPGQQAKTCGAEHAAERKRRRERERYLRVKDTPSWKAVRANYLARLRETMQADPQFAEQFRAYGREQTRKWYASLAQTPERLNELLRLKREERQQWRERILSDPMGWEAYKFKARAWYSGLTPEDRQRIFYDPRKKPAA